MRFKMSKNKKKEEPIIDQEQHLEAESQAQAETSEDAQNDATTVDPVEDLTHQLGVEKDKHLRLFAEFENYKKRTGRERVELFKTAGQEIMQALLPVLDDFDRALVQLHKEEEGPAVEGVTLIRKKLTTTLEAKGLKEIPVQAGDKFDSEDHNAVTQIPAPSEDLKGMIVDVIEKGYTLGDKVIRHPKVVVGQ